MLEPLIWELFMPFHSHLNNEDIKIDCEYSKLQEHAKHIGRKLTFPTRTRLYLNCLKIKYCPDCCSEALEYLDSY